MGCVSSKLKRSKRRPPQNGTSEDRPSRINSSSRVDDLSHTTATLDRSGSREFKIRLIESEKFSSSRFSEYNIEKKAEIQEQGGDTDHLVPKSFSKVTEAVVHPRFKNSPEIPEVCNTDRPVPKDLRRLASVVVHHPDLGTDPEIPEACDDTDDPTAPKNLRKPPSAILHPAAGWPAWLVSVAGEALVGWSPRRASTFEKLEKIGQGTYSSVYRARDLLRNKIVALKKVRFDLNDLESLKFMAREIVILRRLDHPNIIKLEGLITASVSSSLYLVFEYMEHDLVGLASLPGIQFSEPQVKCYLQQLLSGLDHCHSRGVLHRDVKGSNLLIDSNGILKIADFGLATFFDREKNDPLTTRVVTLWYRPPELLLGACHYGIGVDLWSAGCIFGELLAGRPILPGKTEVEQLHKIFKLCGSPLEDYWRKSKIPPSTAFRSALPYGRRVSETFKDSPAHALSLLEILLSLDPDHRGSAASALDNQFFRTEPLACDPSCLPKYPPSKEIDAKLRDEARENRPIREKHNKQDSQNRRSNHTKPLPPIKANQSVTSTMLKQYPEQKQWTSEYPARQIQTVKDMSENTDTSIFYSGPLLKTRKMGRSMNVKESIPSSRMGPPRVNSTSVSSLMSGRIYTNRERQEQQAVAMNQRRPDRMFRSETMDKQMKPDTTDTSWLGNNDCKMYMSGPLLAQPSKVDQMLEEHDRQLQEFARQSRKPRN